MKLGDMSFEDSRNAELVIAPIAERIMKDAEVSAIFDAVLKVSDKPYSEMDAAEKVAFVQSKVEAGGKLVKRLTHFHFNDICEIFAVLTQKSAAEIKAIKRSEANALLTDMINDGDMQSFFISSEALALVAQSAI